MENPFDIIVKKLDQVLETNNRLLAAIEKNQVLKKIPFKAFCKEHGISRPTGYAWHERGLIRIEKIGGRNYVVSDSISTTAKKYQRK